MGHTMAQAPAKWWPRPSPGERDPQLAGLEAWPARGHRRHAPLGRGGDGVDDLQDAMQGGVRADGHVSAAEVVVDGAHHPHHVEVRMLLYLPLVNLACGRHKPHCPSQRAARPSPGVGHRMAVSRGTCHSGNVFYLSLCFLTALHDRILYTHGIKSQIMVGVMKGQELSQMTAWVQNRGKGRVYTMPLVDQI